LTKNFWALWQLGKRSFYEGIEKKERFKKVKKKNREANF
jgi:hypothetical protein